MHCKPLIINYVMHAYGLFSCNARRNFIEWKHFKKHLHVLLNFIIDPNKLRYFPWYLDAFFPSVAFSFCPFPKKMAFKKVFWGHIGSQVNVSASRNTGLPLYYVQYRCTESVQKFHLVF